MQGRRLGNRRGYPNLSFGTAIDIRSAAISHSWEMRRSQRLNVSAPSSSLLQFLKSQSEEVCYFTPNHSPTLRRRFQSQVPRKASYYTHIDRLPPSARRFSTNRRCCATVEPPILSTDFPRIAPRPEVTNQFSTGTASSPSTLGPNVSQDSATNRRYASTDSRPLLKRLWYLNREKPDSALKPNDLPPLPSFLDDGAGTTLGRSKGKAANELKLRCTEINEKGEVTLVNGEFKKSELIAKVRHCVRFHIAKGLTSLSVRSSSPRPAKNRLFPIASHSCPSFRNSN